MKYQIINLGGYVLILSADKKLVVPHFLSVWVVVVVVIMIINESTTTQTTTAKDVDSTTLS